MVNKLKKNYIKLFIAVIFGIIHLMPANSTDIMNNANDNNNIFYLTGITSKDNFSATNITIANLVGSIVTYQLYGTIDTEQGKSALNYALTALGTGLPISAITRSFSDHTIISFWIGDGPHTWE